MAVCRDTAGFAALGPEWSALHGRCPEATPFQSHAWLHSWWLSYGGRRGRLRVVVVRHGGRLVAAAPLARVGGPLPAVVPLGGAVTDYSDVLLDPAHRPGAVDALLAGLRRAARGAVLDLREVRPGGAAELLYTRWEGPRRRLPDSLCLELPGGPMDALIARVGSSRGQRIRSDLRKIAAAGLAERQVPVAEVPAAVARLLRLHQEQWRGRGITPEHLRPRFAEHLARACGAMAASGEAAVTEFRLPSAQGAPDTPGAPDEQGAPDTPDAPGEGREADAGARPHPDGGTADGPGGELVAADLTLLSPALCGGYLFGARPAALRAARVDTTTLLMRLGARHTAEGGLPVLSLLRGDEPHKAHWRPGRAVNSRLMMAGPFSAPLLAARYAPASARARLRGRPLPRLRAARARLMALRAALAERAARVRRDGQRDRRER
ncbi:GNAT family N-acetyltransferase [Actinacidiphila yeochonensis]|uniref:GNAT family N-acetyltransferase n=1 Tax=Actinacidiphila yeochonensis TaxID=89050 RepID=UPI0007C83846|nr:GNAT family N-acetyltransferase [Actinacidiphila yeochonensis]